MIIDHNSYTPGSARINIYIPVEKRSRRWKGARETRGLKAREPPLEVRDQGARGVSPNKLHALKGSSKIGKGGEAGTAIRVDKGDVAKCAVDAFDITQLRFTPR